MPYVSFRTWPCLHFQLHFSSLPCWTSMSQPRWILSVLWMYCTLSQYWLSYIVPLLGIVLSLRLANSSLFFKQSSSRNSFLILSVNLLALQHSPSSIILVKKTRAMLRQQPTRTSTRNIQIPFTQICLLLAFYPHLHWTCITCGSLSLNTLVYMSED